MDVSWPSFPGSDSQANSTIADPRLRPTPDYGTLGPGSDARPGGPDSASQPARTVRGASLLAAVIGVLLAALVGGLHGAHDAWSLFAALFSHHAVPASPALAGNSRQLDRMKPQKQAEALLELAVAHSDGAVDQISSRLDRWQGKLKWDSQLASLATAALNSTDSRVRESGVEVELSAYRLAKNSASLKYLLKTAESAQHAQKIWALWALGLMGNRGIESDRVVEALMTHLKDSDPDSRRWAVEGLALVGTSETIPILLDIMHDDPSPLVRERAACSVAQSGMFTHEQRMSAVPQLLNYTDDPSLDAQTRAWALLALSDITGQRLGNDPTAWRHWYETQLPSGQ